MKGKCEFTALTTILVKNIKMSFAGHVFDMIQRARNNSALLVSKKIRFQRLKETHARAKAKRSFLLNDKKFTKEDWIKYKQELIEKLIQQRKNEIYFIFLFVTILLFMGGFFVWLLIYW